MGGAAFLDSIVERFKPVRKYRPTAALWESAAAAPDARVHSCLLEFGERTVAAASVAAAPDGGDDAAPARGSTAAAAADLERKFAALQVRPLLPDGFRVLRSASETLSMPSPPPPRQRSARAEEESARQAAVRREGALLGQMTEARGGAVSGSNVGAILGLQSEELRRAAAQYQAQADDLRALAEGGELMAVRGLRWRLCMPSPPLPETPSLLPSAEHQARSRSCTCPARCCAHAEVDCGSAHAR